MINRCCLPASKCCTACIESLTPKAPYKAVYEFPPSDRALRDIRRQAGTATRRRSAPSAAIRRSVPVRTFDDWDDPPPGFVEADLVAHGTGRITQVAALPFAIGYRRFKGLEAAAALAQSYAAMRLFVIFFQPSFKLASKARDGALVRKRYHPSATPCQRLMADPRTSEEVRGRVQECGPCWTQFAC
jgi:hypothetical protein